MKRSFFFGRFLITLVVIIGVIFAGAFSAVERGDRLHAGLSSGLCLFPSHIIRCDLIATQILRCDLYPTEILRCDLYPTQIIRCHFCLSK